MGTVVSIDLRPNGGAPVTREPIGAVVGWLHHVNEVFNTHDPGSPISAMGRGELSYEDASDEIREVLRLCEDMTAQTNGCFNAFSVPAPNGTNLETSGLVKGWAIEHSARLVEQYGYENFCLNAGGDVALRGQPEPGLDWRVGIRHPFDDQSLALTIRGTGRLAVATSAVYERGQHIHDPRTLEAASGLASATVVGPDLTVADAYATAVFVMGLDALDWIQGFPEYDLYLITGSGTTHWSEGFNRYRG